MPSRRRLSLPDQPLTFFVDGGLGRGLVPDVFRQVGWQVVLMAVLHPDGLDQFIGDDQWIADVAERGWVALTKDAAIDRRHADALRHSTLRAFALSNANITGPEMAERFHRNRHRIAQRARRPGPFVDGVHKDRLERVNAAPGRLREHGERVDQHAPERTCGRLRIKA
jgi:hypothetical protein